jgi:hypothetical protein
MSKKAGETAPCETEGMLPPLLCYTPIEFRSAVPILLKNPGVRDELFIMPTVTLSTDITLQSEHVQRAAYYPRGSVRSDALIYAMSAGRTGSLQAHEQNFLYVCTIDGAVHVCGRDAAQDATALEEAGIQVYRSPNGDC